MTTMVEAVEAFYVWVVYIYIHSLQRSTPHQALTARVL